MKSRIASKNLLNHSHRLAAVALFISVSALAGIAQLPAQSTQTSISNFGKVNDNYFRGAQPDADQFVELKRLGIKTIIDLREDFEREEAGWVKAQGLQYFRIPPTTRTPATAEQTANFLKLAGNPDNWPIYVHCKGGKHRTGEMTAVYRITNDRWTADQAYQEMKKYRFESRIFGGPDALKKYVYRFYEDNLKASTAAENKR